MWLLRHALNEHKKILWIAHRQMLLEQAAESFTKYAYDEVIPKISSFDYRIVSGATSHERTNSIVPSDNLLIASKDSLGRNMTALDGWLDGEDEVYLIIDEAHHSTLRLKPIVVLLNMCKKWFLIQRLLG
jgi:superfamily II DNA or RNA helicase